jgi:hypothetical protein
MEEEKRTRLRKFSEPIELSLLSGLHGLTFRVPNSPH